MKLMILLVLTMTLTIHAGSLENAYKKVYSDTPELKILKKFTMSESGKAIPTLIKVMKDSSYPIKNRWVATFMLGKIAGKKASPFIAKFLEHPDWVMRIASLKTLLALKEKGYASHYGQKLRDKSLIVRSQALENISHLKLNKSGSDVVKMLVDERNYHKTKKGLVRTQIISKVIKTLGDLKFKKAKPVFEKMLSKKSYSDIHTEIKKALAKI